MTATNHNHVYIVGQKKPVASKRPSTAVTIKEASRIVAEYKKTCK